MPAIVPEQPAEGEAAVDVLGQQLSLMQTMEQLAKVGAWSIDLATFEIDSSPGIFQIYEADPDGSSDTLAAAQERCLPEYRPTLMEQFGRVVQDGTPFDHVLPYRTNSDRIIWVRSIGLRDEKDGIPTRVRGVLVDVTTEHNALEQVQELNTQLEQRVIERTASLATANSELEAFSYSVSHDLRSPLRAIAGFAQLLDTKFGDTLEPKARHYLNNILTASGNMSVLIEELLEYSKLGQETSTPRPTTLQPLFDRLKENFAERASTINAIFKIPGADENTALPTPLGDITLIDQILTNLIDNALKYHNPDTTPVIAITTHETAHTVTIDVTDNGIGIPPEYHDRIFEVFQRLHTEIEYPGTGIGLASARKAATRLNGTLTVHSAPGTTTFTLQLPTAMTAEPGAANTPESGEQ